jgi:hypothetical protein
MTVKATRLESNIFVESTFLHALDWYVLMGQLNFDPSIVFCYLFVLRLIRINSFSLLYVRFFYD